MKTVSILAATSIAVALAPVIATAQPQIQVPPVEVHRLLSKEVGDSFEIRVLMPPMIPGEKTRFPVVYMTDAVHGFALPEDGMRLMMMMDVPRFIAVGIGYPGAQSLLQALAIRTRDLTQAPMPNQNTGFGVPIEGALKPAIEGGGAAKFLAFIRTELIPFIDARYQTDPKDRGYWGDSLGGLFGCFVLFTQPDTFNRYIIGSPSIWWAGEDVLTLAEAYTKTHADLPANVFMGVGGLEEVGALAPFRIVTDVFRLEGMLRAKKYPGLQLTTRVFPDESHTTVAAMNLIRGLVSVFGPPAPGEGIMAKYAEIAKPGKPGTKP